MAKKKEKCLIYTRVSTKKQDEKSQVQDLTRYAKANGFQIVSLPFSEKVSGYDPDADRRALEEMKEYAVKNNIKHILVYEVSRIARSVTKINIEIDFFTKHGINIFIKDPGINTLEGGEMTRIFISLLGHFGKIERDLFINRVTRGKITAAQDGKRGSFARMPYGYTTAKDKKLKLEPTESKWVEKMFLWLKQGKSIHGIANELNLEGVPTRHTTEKKMRKLHDGTEIKVQWRSNSVRRILKSTLYKGERYIKDFKEPMPIPNIVSNELWEEVNDILDKNINHTLATKHNYLLKGKIKCGRCNYAYLSRTDKKGNGLNPHYFCSGRKDKSIECKNGQFKAEILDSAVYINLFSHTDLWEQLQKETIDSFDIETKQNEIKFCKEEIIKLDIAKNKNNLMFKQGGIDDRIYIKENTRIKSETLNFENRLTKIQKEIDNFMKNKNQEFDLLYSYLSEKNFDIRRDLVEKYVDKVVLHRPEHFSFNFSHLLGHEDSEDGEGLIIKPLKKPHGNDTVMYVELFAFGNSKPIKFFLTNVSDIHYISQDLEYDPKTLTLHKEGADYPDPYYYPYPLED